jgi:hypothetical protein
VVFTILVISLIVFPPEDHQHPGNRGEENRRLPKGIKTPVIKNDRSHPVVRTSLVLGVNDDMIVHRDVPWYAEGMDKKNAEEEKERNDGKDEDPYDRSFFHVIHPPVVLFL